MAAIEHERHAPAERLLQEVSQLDTTDLDTFLDRVLMLRAERRAPHLSKRESQLFEILNRVRSPEAQERFDLLVTRRRANKITAQELTELTGLTNQSEVQAAERVRAVSELAQLRGLSFDEMWRRLGL